MKLFLCARAVWTTLHIDLKLGSPAIGASLTDRQVALADGSKVGFDILVAATGVDPIYIPGGQCLRTLEDAITIGEALDRARRVVVVGAGVLGGELAALAISKDKQVTLLDGLSAPMIDRVGPIVGARLAALHVENGVEAHYGCSRRNHWHRMAARPSACVTDAKSRRIWCSSRSERGRRPDG